MLRCLSRSGISWRPKLGVMDEEYARTADDPDSVVGRKVRLARADVKQLNGLVERIR